MSELNENKSFTGTSLRLKMGLAEMLKGGVIMDVMNVEQARIAEEAGATSVMALERVPGHDSRRGRRGPHGQARRSSSRSSRPSPSRSWPRRASATLPRRRFCRSWASTLSTRARF